MSSSLSKNGTFGKDFSWKRSLSGFLIAFIAYTVLFLCNGIIEKLIKHCTPSYMSPLVANGIAIVLMIILLFIFLRFIERNFDEVVGFNFIPG